MNSDYTFPSNTKLLSYATSKDLSGEGGQYRDDAKNCLFGASNDWQAIHLWLLY